jgi:hypothetical protein
LANLQLGDVQSYDVSRVAAIYADNTGHRWWTKAWFNGREKGEKAVEIPRAMAIKFVNDEISKDAWLSRFYPKQMSVLQNALAQTRQQLLGL